jgi:hypothetical protein
LLKIGLIYFNTFLVISATVSTNSCKGLFRKQGIDRRPHVVIKAKLPNYTRREHLIYIQLAIDY